MEPELTVCVLTFNRLEYTRRGLTTLCATVPSGVPIVVFDNNSQDGTQAFLQKLLSQKKISMLFLWDKNIGTAAAKNFLAQYAETKYVALFDNDFEYFDGWVEKILRVMNASYKICAVTPWNLHELSHSFREGTANVGGEKVHWMQRLGGHVVVRRDLFLSSGGFVQQVSPYAGKTASPCLLKIKSGGYKLACIEGTLARGLDRLENKRNKRDDKEYKYYRDWVHLQTQDEIVVPDFYDWRKAEVDIVIPVYGRLEETHRCLVNLYKNTIHPFHLFVVNDGPETDMPRLKQMQKEFGFTLLSTGEKRGFPATCNIGSASGKAPYICFLNTDTVPAGKWLTYLICFIEMNSRAGAAGPSTSRTSQKQQLGEYHGKRFTMTDEQIVQAGQDVFRQYRGKIIGCELSGFCLLTRRSLYESVGGFDEGYRLGYGEENQYQMQLWAAGYKTYWVKHSYVHHFGGLSFKLIPQHEVKGMRRANKQRVVNARRRLRKK